MRIKADSIRRLLLMTLLVLGVVAASAQYRRGGRGIINVDRGNVPRWELDAEFKHDAFVFNRAKYRSSMDRSSYSWWTDYPDADLNMSFRLQQLTALKVNPDGKITDLLDKDLFDYPFLFMSGVPAIVVNDDEVRVLRRYLLSGGFLMVDDFWGEIPWEHFAGVMKRVFPDRPIHDLGLDHEIFHAIFELKEQPQIPNVGFAVSNRGTGVTWEVPDGKTPHYRAIFDDKGRIMVMMCHNTDLGDGWEEEGTDPYYFTEFSEKKAYPLGINIIFYAMTH